MDVARDCLARQLGGSYSLQYIADGQTSGPQSSDIHLALEPRLPPVSLMMIRCQYVPTYDEVLVFCIAPIGPVMLHSTT